ncbi:MAG: hypothetical protein KatS3mg108_2618 [Isosphaeraceae bacterium]|nr:MAG: hypothetical protein KatS3mg108_2618 [Isosphaeraceae bacterium]
MPVSRRITRKAEEAAVGVRGLARSADRLPGRIVVFVVVRDESGSMARWRQRQGEFIPAVAAHLMEVGGAKVGDLVYILYVVVSGGVMATEFVPLKAAADPEFTADGQTPLGRGFKVVAAKCEEFLQTKVFPQEVTTRNFELLIVSDLQPTGESKEETEAGVEEFLSLVAKYKAKVTLVGPAHEAMNQDLARRLDVSGRGVKYLDSDPKAVLDITFDSLLSASRPALGGSNPAIRIR